MRQFVSHLHQYLLAVGSFDHQATKGTAQIEKSVVDQYNEEMRKLLLTTELWELDFLETFPVPS